MTVITQGDAEGAPYRRLRVLKNLKGLAYEAPDPKNISAEFRDIGSDNMTLPQLGKIIVQLHSLRLAVFSRGEEGRYEYGTWGETITIKNLDTKLLDKLIKKTRSDIDKQEGYRPRRRINVPLPHWKGFHERHKIIADTLVGAAALILGTYVISEWPTVQAFLNHHVFSQSKSETHKK